MSGPTRSAPGTPRGWLTLYVVAFAAMLAAGATLGLAARALLEDTGLLMVSAALSGVAIVAAIVALVVPRRG